MFEDVLVGVVVWPVIGLLARATTLSGRRIDYIISIRLDTEVLLNVTSLALSSVVLLAAGTGWVTNLSSGSVAAGVVSRSSLARRWLCR